MVVLSQPSGQQGIPRTLVDFAPGHQVAVLASGYTGNATTVPMWAKTTLLGSQLLISVLVHVWKFVVPVIFALDYTQAEALALVAGYELVGLFACGGNRIVHYMGVHAGGLYWKSLGYEHQSEHESGDYERSATFLPAAYSLCIIVSAVGLTLIGAKYNSPLLTSQGEVLAGRYTYLFFLCLGAAAEAIHVSATVVLTKHWVLS